MVESTEEYGRSVFINCPFDEAYHQLLRPLLFTIVFLGYTPAGIDIKAHRAEPKVLIRRVRNWFVETVGLRRIASPTDIWYEFGDFMTAFNTARKDEGFSEEDLRWMPVGEYVDFIREWLKTSDP